MTTSYYEADGIELNTGYKSSSEVVVSEYLVAPVTWTTGLDAATDTSSTYTRSETVKDGGRTTSYEVGDGIYLLSTLYSHTGSVSISYTSSYSGSYSHSATDGFGNYAGSSFTSSRSQTYQSTGASTSYEKTVYFISYHIGGDYATISSRETWYKSSFSSSMSGASLTSTTEFHHDAFGGDGGSSDATPSSARTFSAGTSSATDDPAGTTIESTTHAAGSYSPMAGGTTVLSTREEYITVTNGRWTTESGTINTTSTETTDTNDTFIWFSSSAKSIPDTVSIIRLETYRQDITSLTARAFPLQYIYVDDTCGRLQIYNGYGAVGSMYAAEELWVDLGLETYASNNNAGYREDNTKGTTASTVGDTTISTTHISLCTTYSNYTESGWSSEYPDATVAVAVYANAGGDIEAYVPVCKGYRPYTNLASTAPLYSSYTIFVHSSVTDTYESSVRGYGSRMSSYLGRVTQVFTLNSKDTLSMLSVLGATESTSSALAWGAGYGDAAGDNTYVFSAGIRDITWREANTGSSEGASWTERRTDLVDTTETHARGIVFGYKPVEGWWVTEESGVYADHVALTFTACKSAT